MRIVTLNILRGGGDRFGRILEVLQGLSPDVVALQECLGWEDGVRLAETSRALGLRETFLGLARPRSSGLSYHVALLSRWPLENRVTYANPGVNAHCAARASVQGVEVLTTHLDGHDEDLRLAEARWLSTLGLQHRQAVLAADLNSLSPYDPYPADLDERLERACILKYGRQARRDVMFEFHRAGWRDALHLRGQPAEWVTAVREGISFRTDYALVAPTLTAQVEECRVQPVGEDVSDHCPVLLSLSL